MSLLKGKCIKYELDYKLAKCTILISVDSYILSLLEGKCIKHKIFVKSVHLQRFKFSIR